MHLNEFLSSLFWVLDAKRLEKSKEKVWIKLIDIFIVTAKKNNKNCFLVG
jgi:hypothetical protein